MNWHKKLVDKKMKFYGFNPYQGMWLSFFKGVFLTLLIFFLYNQFAVTEHNYTKFEIVYPDKFQKNGYDGRLLLMISNNKNSEPRFQINDSHKTQIIFGIDVDSWNSGEKIIIDSKAIGYPINSIKELEEGEYYIQALLHYIIKLYSII